MHRAENPITREPHMHAGATSYASPTTAATLTALPRCGQGGGEGWGGAGARIRGLIQGLAAAAAAAASYSPPDTLTAPARSIQQKTKLKSSKVHESIGLDLMLWIYILDS